MANSLRTTPRTRLGEILETEGRMQSWLASRVGVTRSRMSDYVNGLHVPDDRKVAIAQALGREIEDVFPKTSEQAA